jgi:hypothetical protein
MSEETAPSGLGDVKVGDKNLTITRFRGLKGILAGALVARVMRKIPDLNKKVAEFNKDFRENNYAEITRGMMNLPAYANLNLTEQDFEANGGPIILPMDPSRNDVIQHIFPELWELAQEELTRFFALLVISNSDLESADDSDEVETVLTAKGKEIIRAGYLDELLELFLVSWEVLRDQIMRKRERLEKMSALPIVENLLSMLDQTAPTEEEETPPTSPDVQPTSSTDSPDSTDGADEKLSTESPGESSSTSSQLTNA